jgi:Zn-dependent protease
VTLDATTVIFFVGLITAVVLHELAHGVVAYRLGDDTARRAGRLTLNPIKHLDPVGSVLLPALGALSGLPVLGYAKPVPVSPSRLRSPRRDMVLVALAGPGCNLVLAMASALAVRFFAAHPSEPVRDWSDLDGIARVGIPFALVNLFLGLFNLIPIPPLDGSRLVERFLPVRWLPGWRRLTPYGFMVVFVIVLYGGADWFFVPAMRAFSRVFT